MHRHARPHIDTRKLLFEQLETRRLLTSDFTNPANALDVNNDGQHSLQLE